jgi:hypothetical protein
MSKPRYFYVYKMTTDNGGAPCVCDGLLSLAICKPQIRKNAPIGSLIIGIGGKALGGRLIYAARVTGKLSHGCYYRAKCFHPRPDCIYRELNGLAQLNTGPRYHDDGSQLEKDVGRHFEHANVLLSTDFRYFGKKGTDQYKSHEQLSNLIEVLTQGHRVNHSRKLIEELEELTEHLWKAYSSIHHGEPSDGDFKRPCNRESKCLSLSR